jgi:hypothetical protein
MCRAAVKGMIETVAKNIEGQTFELLFSDDPALQEGEKKQQDAE